MWGAFFSLPAGLPYPTLGLWGDGGVVKPIPQPCTPPTPARLAGPYLGDPGPPSPCGEPGRPAQCADSPLQWAEPSLGPPPPSSRPCSACWGSSWGPAEVAAAACGVRPSPLRGKVEEDG